MLGFPCGKRRRLGMQRQPSSRNSGKLVDLSQIRLQRLSRQCRLLNKQSNVLIFLKAWTGGARTPDCCPHPGHPRKGGDGRGRGLLQYTFFLGSQVQFTLVLGFSAGPRGRWSTLKEVVAVAEEEVVVVGAAEAVVASNLVNLKSNNDRHYEHYCSRDLPDPSYYNDALDPSDNSNFPFYPDATSHCVVNAPHKALRVTLFYGTQRIGFSLTVVGTDANGSGVTESRICSTGLNDRFRVEDCENSLIRILSSSRCCSNDGSHASEQIGSPLERKPPVTLRYVAVGRNSRSLPLLSGGTSGCSRKVNRWPRSLP